MKGKLANLRRSGLCLLLAVCLMMGMSSFAFAAAQNDVENGKHEAIDAAIAKMIDLVVKYHGDAYKFAYEQAEKAGYIDAALDYMDEVLVLLDDEAAEMQAKLDELKNELDSYKDDVAEAEQKLAEAEEELNGYKADLAQAKADLAQAEADLAAGGVDAEADIAKAKADIAKAEADIADADVKLADAKAQLADAKAQMADAEQKLDEAQASLDGLVVEVKESVAAAKALVAEADVLDQAALDALDALFVELEQDTAKMAEIMEIMEGVEVEVPEMEQFGDIYAAYVVLTEDVIPVVKDDVIPTIQAAQAYAQEFISDVMTEYGITFENAAERIPELVYNATHGKYVMSKESYYVALGGATAAQKGYVNLFAKELGLENAYADLTVADLSVADAVANVKANAAAIQKADIITYQMDPQMIVEAALNGTADWSVYVKDAELLAQVEEMKDTLLAEIAKEYDENTVNEVAAQVENAVFAFVSYATENAKVIKTIKELNSDAVIVMLGMYNPFQGLVFEVEGVEVDLGALCDNAVVVSDVGNLMFSLTSGGIVYVEISMAPTVGFDKVVLDIENPKASLNKVLKALNDQKSMTVTEAGQQYIYEEILEALEIVKLPADTGDNTNVFLWASVAMLCAAAFVGMVGTDKVKNCAK